jgi:cytochrome b561
MEWRYSPTARALHWLTVAAILAQFGLGMWLAYAAPEEMAFKLRLYALHENIGFTLLPITLFRLWHRHRHPPAPLPEDLPPAMRLAAHANHAALYLALLGLPLLGVWATAAFGFPFAWLGVIPIPSPFGKNEALAPLLKTLHALGAWLLGLAILAHVGGALYHGLVRRDGILRRML